MSPAVGNHWPARQVLQELQALFSVLVLWLEDIWDLSSPTRDVIGTPAFGRQSLSHGTSKDVPGASVLTQDGKEVDFGHFFAHLKQPGKLKSREECEKEGTQRDSMLLSGHVCRWPSTAQRGAPGSARKTGFLSNIPTSSVCILGALRVLLPRKEDGRAAVKTTALPGMHAPSRVLGASTRVFVEEVRGWPWSGLARLPASRSSRLWSKLGGPSESTGVALHETKRHSENVHIWTLLVVQ